MKQLILLGLMVGMGLGIAPAVAFEPAQRAPDPAIFLPAHALMQIMGSPVQAQEFDHDRLLHIHSEAGVTCQGCHGDEGFSEPVNEAVCTDCHGSYDEIAALTPWEPNPHDSHLGEIPCAMCHKVHVESESFCDACHSFGMVVP